MLIFVILMAVIGLGGGFEIGTGSSLMAKYSILDERRHDTPVSVAIAAKGERHPDGTRSFRDKDTLANIRQVEHFVVHPAPASLWREVHATGAALPPEVDEAEASEALSRFRFRFRRFRFRRFRELLLLLEVSCVALPATP